MADGDKTPTTPRGRIQTAGERQDFPSPSSGRYSNKEAELELLRKQLAQMNADIASLHAENASLRATVGSLVQKFKDAASSPPQTLSTWFEDVVRENKEEATLDSIRSLLELEAANDDVYHAPFLECLNRCSSKFEEVLRVANEKSRVSPFDYSEDAKFPSQVSGGVKLEERVYAPLFSVVLEYLVELRKDAGLGRFELKREMVNADTNLRPDFIFHQPHERAFAAGSAVLTDEQKTDMSINAAESMYQLARYCVDSLNARRCLVHAESYVEGKVPTEEYGNKTRAVGLLTSWSKIGVFVANNHVDSVRGVETLRSHVLDPIPLFPSKPLTESEPISVTEGFKLLYDIIVRTSIKNLSQLPAPLESLTPDVSSEPLSLGPQILSLGPRIALGGYSDFYGAAAEEGADQGWKVVRYKTKAFVRKARLQHEYDVLRNLAAVDPPVPHLPKLGRTLTSQHGGLEAFEVGPVGIPFEEAVAIAKKLPDGEAVAKIRQVLSDVLETLKMAHEARYVHLDVRPSNIVVVVEEGKWEGFLVDWGLAEEIGTRIRGMRGVREFAPDEVVKSSKTHWGAAPKHDLESFAYTCVAAHGFSLNPPWKVPEEVSGVSFDTLCGRKHIIETNENLQTLVNLAKEGSVDDMVKFVADDGNIFSTEFSPDHTPAGGPSEARSRSP